MKKCFVLFVLCQLWSFNLCEINYPDVAECKSSILDHNVSKACTDFENCCPDIKSTRKNINREIKNLPDLLIHFDPYNVGNQIVFHQEPPLLKCSKSKEVSGHKYILHIPNSTWTIPSVVKFKGLHDNFDPRVTKDDVPTGQELSEQEDFINTLLDTPVMRATHGFLQRIKIFCGNWRDFRHKVIEIWFGMYDRDGKLRWSTMGSNGFEHVFLGEIKKSKVTGFHNWIYFALEETAGRLLYHNSRVEPKRFGNYGYAVANKFVWQDKVKCFGGMLLGTTPEFELALYTTCFLAKPHGSCKLRFQGKKLTIQTHVINLDGKKLVGSAYIAL